MNATDLHPLGPVVIRIVEPSRMTRDYIETLLREDEAHGTITLALAPEQMEPFYNAAIAQGITTGELLALRLNDWIDANQHAITQLDENDVEQAIEMYLDLRRHITDPTGQPTGF